MTSFLCSANMARCAPSVLQTVNMRNDYVVREQEAQLPQRNSASAARMEGARPSSQLPPSAPSGYTYAYGRIRKPQRMYVKCAVH